MFQIATFVATMAAVSAAPSIQSFLDSHSKLATSTFGQRRTIDRSSISTQAKNDGTTGWYEVRQFVNEGTCDGSYVTEFFEYGNCVADLNGEYSMLEVSGDPTSGNFYVFNRTFYVDEFCETPNNDTLSYLLPNSCAAKDSDDFYADDNDMTQYGIYVADLTTKLSISRKTAGYISWNTEEQCANGKEKEASYMLATNFKSCYPNMNFNLTYESDDFYNGDDNMTAYGSLEIQSCRKVRYFMTDDCTGDYVTLKDTMGEDDDAAACSMEDGDETDVELFSTYYCKSKNRGRRNVCFAGSETILTQSGITKMISEVAIGDRVQVYSPESASMEFSEVIAVPHAKNNELATFVQITTASSSVKMTPDHLVAAGACSADAAMLPLVRAETVQAGDCVHTSAGKSMVSAVKTVEEEGIYTFVTRAEFIVVGDIVASPFAVNHEILNFFYNIHRALPTNSPLVEIFHAVADQITKIAVLPGVMSLFAVSA